MIDEKDKLWVLVDANFLAYRAFYTMGNLSFEDIPTGVIFGFLDQLLNTCSLPGIRSNKVAIFFDSKASWRKQEFPQYKAKRNENKTKEEIAAKKVLFRQITKLRTRILPDMGFPVRLQKGLEADDLIGSTSFRLSCPRYGKAPGIMITADQDLYQCITENIAWYDPTSKKYFDLESFKRAKKTSPYHWVLVKAIAGCSSDNVPGVMGVGEKTAIAYLNEELPKKSKKYQSIVAAKDLIIRNGRLVSLPHARTVSQDPVLPDYNWKNFVRWCKRLGMGSYLEDEQREAWKHFFDGDMGTADPDFFIRTRKRKEIKYKHKTRKHPNNGKRKKQGLFF